MIADWIQTFQVITPTTSTSNFIIMDTNDASQDLGSAFLTNDAQFIVQSDGN